MVQIQVKYSSSSKSSNESEYLYECESNSRIEDITKATIEIANLQLQIQHLSIQLLSRLSSLIHTHPKEIIPLHRALSEAQSYTSKQQIMHSKPISSHALRDQIRSIEKEFRMSYQVAGFSDSNFEQLLEDAELLEENTTQLWWAGKEFVKGKRLCDYIGKNEKTKIVLRLVSPIAYASCNTAGDASS